MTQGHLQGQRTGGVRVMLYAFALFAAGIILALWMASHPHAEDAPEHWKIVFSVTDPNAGHMRFTYGTRETGPVYFPSEAVCKEAIEKDDKVQLATAKLLEAVKEHDATYEGVTCVLDLALAPGQLSA